MKFSTNTIVFETEKEKHHLLWYLRGSYPSGSVQDYIDAHETIKTLLKWLNPSETK